MDAWLRDGWHATSVAPRGDPGPHRLISFLALSQFLELPELPQRLEHFERLLLIHNGQGKAHMHQNVVSYFRFGCIVHAHFLADSPEINPPTPQSEVSLFQERHYFPRHSQAHGRSSILQQSGEHRLPEGNAAVVRWHLVVRG